ISVTDISLMYGFSSIQSFSRSFRNQYNITPLKYRSADRWDMQYAQPIMYSNNLGKGFQILEIKAGVKFLLMTNKKC
ncbi:TPA: AraC family transcriptional regulator, partial [Escherichia coli]|nr:AraC family transcriptional regulator [Escherichia coli]EKM2495530.1 AraC family transcriptional regulator [Escherichia coli O26]ELJ1059888.1 AraC family transcriptional regulator [Escherichia coli O168]EET5673633.1 AraC family transcriptional regulator [Escherichia coli]EET6606191.1 AraC family transcriptional regulator [Escherichia coli]